MQEVDVHMPALMERLQQLLQEPHPNIPFIRIEQSVPLQNLLHWLEQQGGCQRTYWRDREADFEIAALDRSWQLPVQSRKDIPVALQTVQRLIQRSGDQAFGAHCLTYLSFSDDTKMVWKAFGYGCVFLSRLEIVQTRRGATLACHLTGDTEQSWCNSIEQAIELLQNIHWKIMPVDTQFRLQPIKFQPEEQDWHRNIDLATKEFASKKMQKVVLSRTGEMKVNGVVSPWLILSRWKAANPRSYVYAIESTSGDVFFGCSPERLFSRKGRALLTEALAGTIRRGDSRGEDRKLERSLLNDAKNIHENRLVLNDISHRLKSLCLSLETDRSHSVVKLKSIQHLRYLIRGVLKPDVSDGQLLMALHPTPAVGGAGREEAMNFIEQHEGYSRGLYAGVCGVVGPDKAELTVSIRCALIRQIMNGLDSVCEQHLSLFSGAGIVQGSDAADEWQELNNKLETVYSLLKASECRDAISDQSVSE